jgi:hypothetical protein
MTHIYFDSDQIDWNPYFRNQQVGQGQVMMGGREDVVDDDKPSPIFRGNKYQRGYGVRGALSSIGRFLYPIASNLMESAKDEAALSLGRIGADLSRGKPIGQTIKQHAVNAAQNLGTRVQQCGKGKREKRAKIIKNLALAEISPDEPITSGPNPIPKRKRKRDYLDL